MNKQLRIDPKALFLGPYSENQAEFRKLVEFLLNDITQWRRNYHPREKRLIEPDDKITVEWRYTLNLLERELDVLLGDMKQSIPFHNPRFIGHMHSDLVLPSLLGYMVGQLYNQNNVVGESSPITTEKELRFIKFLCEMFHYPPFEYSFNDEENINTANESRDYSEINSTGHLTGGGTTANIEALWTARNTKYFPLSLRLLLLSTDVVVKNEWEQILNAIKGLKIRRETLFSCNVQLLFNLSPAEILKLQTELKKVIAPYLTIGTTIEEGKLAESTFANELNKHIVRTLGVYGIHKAVKEKLKLDLDLPYLIVPQSRHYSWEKAMDILGLGSGMIKYVKVDENFKMDPEDFQLKCKEGNPNIIMVVSVVGTTEEGVVDPVDKILEKKTELEKIGKGFWLHIDAAYGGYYASSFNKQGGGFLSYEELNRENGIAGWLTQGLADFTAINQADSITIDPHKMGYVPYSVGAILYRDKRIKSFIEKKAPYLSSAEGEEYDSAKLYLGGSSLEGSRSGAAALACYLSSRVISNDINGYGRLMAETFQNARVFIKKMTEYNEPRQNGYIDNLISIQIHPLYDSLTNIVCYAVSVKGVPLSPKDFKELNERLYIAMSAKKNKMLNDYKFIVSKTSLDYDESDNNPGYAMQINSFLQKFGINHDKLPGIGYELTLLRSTLMSPLMSEKTRDEIYDDYFKYLQELVNRLLPEVLLQSVMEVNDFVRYKILWIENQRRVDKLRQAILIGGSKSELDMSRFLDIKFVTELNDVLLETASSQLESDLKDRFQIFIVDLNLADGYHKEWQSGIELIRKIKSRYNTPIILVYSQFLNPSFQILKKDGKPDENLNNVRHHEIIRNFLKYYFGLADDNLVPKSITKANPAVSTHQPVEMEDLKLLTMKLAKLVFNRMDR